MAPPRPKARTPTSSTCAPGSRLRAAGNKAGAAAALNAVTGPRAGIAKYWLLYLQTKG